MAAIQKKNFSSADEIREYDKGHAEIIKLGDATFMKATFEPGWKWSTSVKPKVGTERCEVHHLGYQMSGKMKVVTNDGVEAESGPGDIIEIQPGHDAWVEGNEPVVFLDFVGGAIYAKHA